jgi:hypothetical protein
MGNEMKTLCTDDTLFLSTQAESIWHLKAALFGKVAIELNQIAADCIFFLTPANRYHCQPCPLHAQLFVQRTIRTLKP